MNESQIFTDALKLASATERAAYLNAVCAGNLQLRSAVEALLRVHDSDPDYLEKSAGAFEVTVDAPAVLPTLPQLELPGTLIGPYKLLEQIGEGGMGTVWMAQQTEPIKRLVAVKLIKAGMDSKQVIARFEAERQALALMDHANIARVLDAGTTSTGRPYFVMDLVKGVQITRYCDEHHLTPRQRLELFILVCQAVQHAHQKGIIHRDLKPSNVLVALHDGKPVPKVIDFGVAKAAGQSLTDKTLVTGFGAIVGTLEYMSPEQAEINQLDIDTRSDIYSLGVMLYELLTGSTPFNRKNMEKDGILEILRVIREDEPTKPSTKLSTAEGLPVLAANRGTEPAKLTRLVRGELDWIVMKALDKDRKRRYETANSFAMDLKRYLADETVQACPPSSWYRLRKFARRHRSALLLTGGLCAVAGVLALGGVFYQQAAQDAERDRKQSEYARHVTEAHEKIPLIQTAIRQAQYQKAYDLLKEIEQLIPDHPSLPELWEQCSQTCTLTTVPGNVDLWLRPYSEPGATWRHLTQTPDRPVALRVPRGEYLWRATKTGYREVTGLRMAQEVQFRLDPEDAIPPEMVRIPQGNPGRPGMATSTRFLSVELPDFLYDRYEVTNFQYDQFVKAGGYDRKDYWQDLPFIDADGKATTWEQVKPLFVDQTGRPGPATWRNGTFRPGEEEHPVRGVSWYEAMAYARYAGKSLPTIYHWVLASQIELSVILAGNEFITRMNFGAHVQPVKSLSDAGLHGAFGMAGNVKEWCVNDTGEGQRYILGGCCGEPIYTPLTLETSPPLRRDEFFGFRCIKFFNNQKGPATAWEPAKRIPWSPAPQRTDLMDAATYRLVFNDRFSYNRKAPLDLTSEQRDEGEWIHITAQVNTVYRDAKGRLERLTLHLYLPKGIDTSKGYQTIVYFPGGDASMLPRMRPLHEEYGLDALVRAGRAVLCPVYTGTYERRYDSPSGDSRSYEEQCVCLGQDLMRAIDYLQQRGDINMNQVGYFGFSEGAEWPCTLVAVEPRLRAAVFEAGGLPITPLRKERLFLEWRHSLPQIQVPVLMLNGQVDPIYPVKESQQPMFQLIGSAIKEHYIHPNGHHMLPSAVKFKHIVRWFDQHLGVPVKAQVNQ